MKAMKTKQETFSQLENWSPRQTFVNTRASKAYSTNIAKENEGLKHQQYPM